jgi:hypothetical protein
MFSSGHRSKMRWAQGECHLCVSTLVNVPGRTPAILPDFSENSHVGGLERWGVRMNDVTRILSAIERGVRRPRMDFCHWSTRNCGCWPLRSSPMNHPARPFKRLYSYMRRISAWWETIPRDGITEGISSRLQPRR